MVRLSNRDPAARDWILSAGDGATGSAVPSETVPLFLVFQALRAWPSLSPSRLRPAIP
jgi:hypothetical protein